MPVTSKGKTEYIEFSGGFMEDGYLMGGTFSTGDEEVQRSIENTQMFKGGEIFVRKSEVDESSNEIVSANEDLSGFKDYPLVKNQQLAEETLRSLNIEIEPGTKKAREIALLARSMNISFSKWSVYNGLE